MSYNVVGVSSGGGVSLYPFLGKILANFEARPIFHTPGDVQWKLNFEDTPLLKKLQPLKQEVDVMISSPDCGSGSILRMSRAKQYGDHKENKSLALFFQGIDLFNPKFFYFENLPGLFQSFPQEEFEQLLPGYRLLKHEAPVSYWGNSQISRVRLVIVGIRKSINPKVDKYFRIPDYRDRVKECKDLYGDLDGYQSDQLGHVREPLHEEVTIYAGKKMTIGDIQRHWNGELKGHKRWIVKDRKFTTAPGVYRNLKRQYPATARKANRQFDHNGLMLTPRQLARIQGVPDDFRIYVDPMKLNYWINKGRALVTKTPPFEIGQWFKKKLDKTLELWR